MITIKNKQAITRMEHAGRELAALLQEIQPLVKVGARTTDLDAWISRQLADRGLVSNMRGYRGYAHVSCISVNDTVVHGVPDDTQLCAGDLVKIDVCASHKGYAADLARCYFVQAVSDEVKKLVFVAQAALDSGIAQARVGNRVSDISHAVQVEVERHGFGVVRIFAGHGIGRHMHEDPEILNYGKPGAGAVLREGMTLAIEPMITLGHYDVYIARDGWTAKTKDKSIAAHVEDTVLVTNTDPRVLTRL